MISDTLDYGGFYDDAREAIDEAGRRAEERLSTVETATDFSDPLYAKQQTWALMMWGMSLYRHADEGYTDALKRFELAKRILLMLKQANVDCTGSLARVSYCIGLVHRQRRDYRVAKAAFRDSVDLAGTGFQARIAAKRSAASFDYNMARCYGLGLGWIAYDESLLSDAKSALVLADRLLLGKKARFIRAYIHLVHACVIMSGSMQLDSIDEGIRRLRIAYEVLAPTKGEGHVPYAVRAANELGQAYVRRARAVPEHEKEANLSLADDYVKTVLDSPTAKKDRRTHANAWIISSRILRDRKQLTPALEAAYKARNIAGGMKFSQIDCSITVGEAAYELGQYRVAVEAFQEALLKASGSRKSAAVCHLHLGQTYFADGQPSKATEHFRQWEGLGAELDNAFIADLGNRLRQQLAPSSGDFRILVATPDLNAENHERQLHAWLANNALTRAKDNYKLAGRLLGKAEGTVRAWLNEADDTRTASAGA